MKLFTLKLWCNWISLKTKIKEMIYCNRGWHRFSSNTWKSINHKKEELLVSYIHCKICNSLFFVSDKDKRIFLRLREQADDNWKKMFKSYIKKKVKIKEFKE